MDGVVTAALLPPFSVSIGVTDINGSPPDALDSFTFTLRDYPYATVGAGPVTVTGTDRAVLTVDQTTVTAMRAAFQSWINPDLIQTLASIITVSGSALEDFTTVTGTLAVAETGATRDFVGELFLRGGVLRIGGICWRHGTDDAMLPSNDTAGGTGDVRTYAQFAQRYVDAAGEVPTRPQLIYDGDYWLTGDSDRLHTEAGYQALARMGCNVVYVSFDPGEIATFAGSGLFDRFSAGQYTTPGGAFPWHPIDANVPGYPPTPAGIAAWAADWNQRVVDAGLDPLNLAHFAMADEPGWYPKPEVDGILASSPTVIRDAQARIDALADFRSYVTGRGYIAADFGVADITDLLPNGDRSVIEGTRAERLLYVTTLRWLANASARHLRDCSAAMLSFFPNASFAANKNNFSSRPVSVASFFPNPYAGFSWLEEGGMPGSHPGSESYVQSQVLWAWSPIVSLLESSSRRANGLQKATSFVIEGGALIAGDYQRRVLVHLMHGAKGLHRYTFGAPYVGSDARAPENLLSLPFLVGDMHDTSELVATHDEALYTGRRADATVALLHPWAGAFFDLGPNDVFDATQSFWFQSSSDHLAEAFSIALALIHAGIPFDWLHEDDLTEDALAGYDFLYVTSPNMAAAHQDAVVGWASEAGHVLITTPSAGSADEANDPLRTVADSAGLTASHTRQQCTDLIGSGAQPWTVTPTAATVAVDLPAAVGVTRDTYCDDPMQYRSTVAGGTALATYVDSGNNAAALAALDAGYRVHFGFFPGLGYTHGAIVALNTDASRLPTNWDADARDWVTWPLRNFGHVAPVESSVPAVESAVLPSGADTAIVPLISWWGEPITTDVTIRAGFGVGQVTSHRHGTLSFARDGDTITIEGLELENVDILRLSAITPTGAALLMVT